MVFYWFWEYLDFMSVIFVLVVVFGLMGEESVECFEVYSIRCYEM